VRERERDVFPLVAAGTIAVHVILLVVIDAGGVYARRDPPRPTPRVELVDIETPPPPPPPPPPPVAKAVEPPKVVEPRRIRSPEPVKADPVPPPPLPPEVTPTDDPGGAPVVKMDLAADPRGTVAVAVGKRTTERVGQGGTGTGTGAGDGAGSARIPVSVATIKTLAKPKGNYDAYGKDADYPAEAKRLGVQGPLKVQLVVDATGKVIKRRVLEPRLGHGLDELALARAATFEFEPARDTTGRAVASIVVWTFNFTLPE
jgi:protein TonB